MSPYGAIELHPWDFNKQPKTLPKTDHDFAAVFCCVGHCSGRNWWKPGMSRNLGNYLLTQAKEAGIHQAVMHPVSAGFLNETASPGTSATHPLENCRNVWN